MQNQKNDSSPLTLPPACLDMAERMEQRIREEDAAASFPLADLNAREHITASEKGE